MKAFNALQVTALFASWPFLCQWVKDAEFYANTIVFWIMVVTYGVGFILMVMSVFSSFDSN
jgi:hypothetical protein